MFQTFLFTSLLFFRFINAVKSDRIIILLKNFIMLYLWVSLCCLLSVSYGGKVNYYLCIVHLQWILMYQHVTKTYPIAHIDDMLFIYNFLVVTRQSNHYKLVLQDHKFEFYFVLFTSARRPETS